MLGLAAAVVAVAVPVWLAGVAGDKR
jgi:hypothetical protein